MAGNRIAKAGRALTGIAAVALAVLPLASRAQGTAAEPAGQSPVAGWDEFVENLRGLPDRMMARLPETMRQDPQLRAEIGRLALEAVASSSIDALGADPLAPTFLPTIGQVLNVGQPNADTVYKVAAVDPGETYRISGSKGTVTLAVMAQMLKGSNSRPHLDLSKLASDAQGNVSVLVGPERPEGYAGDFWQLEPGTRRLMLRIVSSDWSREVQPVLAIERVSGPVQRRRASAQELAARLKGLSQAIDAIAPLFVNAVQKLADEGYVNRFKVMVPPMGALESQFYYDGVFELKDDEALIVESEVSATCRYRSLILTNELYETIDWTNNHSSLNAAQAAPDADGKLRIVISARDPGVRNWLDTAGHPRGMIQGRWTGCDSQPIPRVVKVRFADVQRSLPGDVARVTPGQRQEIVRERNRAYQRRSLW